MSLHCGYNSSYPSVFVDVQFYNTWIKDKMRHYEIPYLCTSIHTLAENYFQVKIKVSIL